MRKVFTKLGGRHPKGVRPAIAASTVVIGGSEEGVLSLATTTMPRLQSRTFDGVRIRYSDSGPDKRNPPATVLLTCPWPESICAFAPLWDSLSGIARLFAIDLPGFGGSDRRDDLLSPCAILDCYDGDRFVESMRYVRKYPEELPALADLLPEIGTPVTIINGRNDRVVPLSNAEFLDQRLPTSRVRVIDAGHFVWEEAPKEYASIVADSIRGEWS